MAAQVQRAAEDSSVGQEEQDMVEEESASTWVHCMLVVMGHVRSGSAEQELLRLQAAPVR